MNADAARQGFHPRRDDVFFLAMATVALLVVFIGFAPTYFLAGLLRAPLPNALVHIHGAAFTVWILLFLAQIFLVASGRVQMHRRLGRAGMGLAFVMVILGILTASDRLARHTAHPTGETVEDVRAFYAIPLADIILFSTFVYLAYRNRGLPTVHKRLMLFATFSLLDAGFDRWPVFDPYPLALVNVVCFVPLVLAMLAYDWWSTGKAQRVTLASSTFLLGAQQLRHVVGDTSAWQGFAAWVAMHISWPL